MCAGFVAGTHPRLFAAGPLQNGLVITAVLRDLDGVVRHFDPDGSSGIEARHGLGNDLLNEVAFAQPLLTEVATGQMTRREWIESIGERVGSTAAAEEWALQRPVVDEEVLRLADKLRAQCIAVAVLTNDTDTTSEEVTTPGIHGRVEAVFNSAEIGACKPDPRSFQHAPDVLCRPAEAVFFVADNPENVSGATALGLPAHVFVGALELETELRSRGLLQG